jgi:predicted negative regulator of RcsB-dependent stress response
MADHHFEQEEVDRLKDWWRRNGTWFSVLLATALFALAGWRGWGWYQAKRSAEAAEVYDRVVIAARRVDAAAVRQDAGTLFEQYPDTAYAPLAALLSAKLLVEQGDLKSARAQLQWVVDRKADLALSAVARIRLAGVLIDEGAHEQALALLEPVAFGADGAFEVARLDRRGDVLLALGRSAEALAAWDEAIKKSEKSATDSRESPLKPLVQLKRDHLAAGGDGGSPNLAPPASAVDKPARNVGR